jgi:hypothetical protein
VTSRLASKCICGCLRLALSLLASSGSGGCKLLELSNHLLRRHADYNTIGVWTDI